MSNLIRGISENGGVVFCGVDSTEIVRTAEQLHHTSATCSAALGRLLTGASLMGSMLKDDGDSITLRVAGGGPTGTVVACTDGTGNVKGCIDHPLVELPLKANGHLDVGGAVGKNGVLTVIRDNRLQKEPTVGQVPLVSGEIAEDLTSYYAYSEQVPTVMALGVLVDKDLSILCAGGFMVQLLPGATDAEIDQLEKNINAMPSVTELLHAGKTPEDMMQMALAGFAPNVLDERTVQYQCDCSAERTKEMLLSLGRAELARMRDEDPTCEVVCHFCHSKYQYDLNALLAEYDAQAAEAAQTADAALGHRAGHILLHQLNRAVPGGNIHACSGVAGRIAFFHVELLNVLHYSENRVAAASSLPPALRATSLAEGGKEAVGERSLRYCCASVVMITASYSS